MKWRSGLGYGAAIALAWVLVAFGTSRPADYHQYHKTALESAGAALSATRTAAVAGTAALDGKVLDPYLSVVLDNATGSIASAYKQLTVEAAPGAAGRKLREEILPLLVTAGGRAADLSDAADHDDRARIRGAVDALNDTGDKLEDFVERHR
jgi:hypothetical protein